MNENHHHHRRGVVLTDSDGLLTLLAGRRRSRREAGAADTQTQTHGQKMVLVVTLVDWLAGTGGVARTSESALSSFQKVVEQYNFMGGVEFTRLSFHRTNARAPR